MQTEQEVIGEIVDYNVGFINDISEKANEVLELITRPKSDGGEFSYVLGRMQIDRVPLRGENEIQIRDITEDYLKPDGIYRIPCKQ